MKSKEEIRNWLLENAVDYNGDLDLTCLDFGDFDGDILMSEMKVKKDLYQDWQEVEGDLYQFHQNVKGDLYQDYQTVEGVLRQDNQSVEKERER